MGLGYTNVVSVVVSFDESRGGVYLPGLVPFREKSWGRPPTTRRTDILLLYSP